MNVHEETHVQHPQSQDPQVPRLEMIHFTDKTVNTMVRRLVQGS